MRNVSPNNPNCADVLLTLFVFTDTPEFYENGPVCLQVLGLRHEEEKIIGLLKSLDKALGRDEFYMA